MDSRALQAVGYDAPSRTLFVRFHAGGLYAYLDVPPETHLGLMAATSKGARFQTQIEPCFRYVRLE